MEIFLIQAWLIWNRRNSVIHRGRFIDPRTLKQRAVEHLEEYKHAQQQLHAELVMQNSRTDWEPPPESAFKLNFMQQFFLG